MVSIFPRVVFFSNALLTIFLISISFLYYIVSSNYADGQVHFEKALQYYRGCRYKEALSESNRLIDLEPQEYSGYHTRGNIFFELHEYEKAVHDYSNAITLNPSDATAFYYRGLSYRHLKKEDLALKDIEICKRILGRPEI